jgi:SAM-dependent methyltransferase
MFKKVSMSEEDAISYWREYRSDKEKRIKAYYKKAAELFPSDAKRVLDVGCAEGSFIELIQEKYFVIGSDFSRAALCCFKNQKTLNDIGNMPFKDGSFDLITCLEVLEHLDKDTFIKAISEMKRVATKYIVVSVPNEEPLDYSTVICPACNCHFNRENHVRSFRENSFKKLFSPDFLPTKLIETGNLEEQPTYSKALIALRLYLKPRLPRSSICPQCGHRSENSQSQASTSNTQLVRTASSKALKLFVNLIWQPKKKRHYLLALFERANCS